MAAPDTRDAGVIPFARPRRISTLGEPTFGIPSIVDKTVQTPPISIEDEAPPTKRSRRSTPPNGEMKVTPLFGYSSMPTTPASSSWGSKKPAAPVGVPTFGSVGRNQVFAPVAPPSGPQAPVTLPPSSFGAYRAPAATAAARAMPAPQQRPQRQAMPALAPVPVAAPFEPVRMTAPLVLPSANEFGAEGPTMQDAPVPNLRPAKWAAFEKLGLVAAKVDPRTWSKHVVTAYRMLGFAILTIIVVVLIGYITTTAFYYWSNSWIVPTALAPTDEKIVALQSQLAERQNQRDQTAMALDQAERAIAVQQAFQGEFAKAIQSDLDGRKAALERMRQLAAAASSTRTQIRRSNNAYAQESKRRMAEEWKAGLIDRNAMLSGRFQLAQITTSNLSLVERQAEYESRAADLEAQTRSLEALLANTATPGAMSYDVLKIKQEYEGSRLDTQKAIETRDILKTALERQDKLLGNLKQSAYIRAMADGAQVAYVPYGNLSKVDKGASLYGCKLGMMFCHKVGTVLDVLPGEVLFKHPNRDKQLRGQMVELKLEDGAAATDDVLFVGGRPLFI
ncbi:MAG: hypothetical protein ABI678_14130 [Kofleriaceae bacterium]